MSEAPPPINNRIVYNSLIIHVTVIACVCFITQSTILQFNHPSLHSFAFKNLHILLYLIDSRFSPESPQVLFKEVVNDLMSYLNLHPILFLLRKQCFRDLNSCKGYLRLPYSGPKQCFGGHLAIRLEWSKKRGQGII